MNGNQTRSGEEQVRHFLSAARMVDGATFRLLNPNGV